MTAAAALASRRLAHPHLTQSYLMSCSCGNTPVRRVTTPLTRTRQFRWKLLRGRQEGEEEGKGAVVSVLVRR